MMFVCVIPLYKLGNLATSVTSINATMRFMGFSLVSLQELGSESLEQFVGLRGQKAFACDDAVSQIAKKRNGWRGWLFRFRMFDHIALGVVLGRQR